MRILSNAFVRKWQGRLINIHPSLLPSFKGTQVHEQAIAAGVRISGCTVHYVIPELDSGPAIAQAAVPVHPSDTAERLAARVLEAEHRLYPLALRLIAEGRVQLYAGRVLFSDVRAPASTLFNPEV
jgi:phosphoribosylglycinamide formyltransferase-1